MIFLYYNVFKPIINISVNINSVNWLTNCCTIIDIFCLKVSYFDTATLHCSYRTGCKHPSKAHALSLPTQAPATFPKNNLWPLLIKNANKSGSRQVNYETFFGHIYAWDSQRLGGCKLPMAWICSIRPLYNWRNCWLNAWKINIV